MAGLTISYEGGTLGDGCVYSGNITVNVSASTVAGVNTIAIYVNESMEKSCYIGTTSGECYLNKLFADGSWKFNATVNDTFGNINWTGVRTVTLDNTAPTLTFNKPSAENSTLVGKWFRQNITVEDANLWWLNCSIHNFTGQSYWSQEWNLTGLTTYTVTNLVDVSSWPLGLYYENCTTRDLTER